MQAELEGRAAEADALRRQHVDRARHAAEAARRRYLAVDPDNRLVAANLEADWNEALRTLTRAQEDYERQTAQAAPLGAEDKARIAALASDFPALWSDPRTPQRERKRMVRLLVEDVTLVRAEDIAVHIRFRGGQTETLHVAVGLTAPEAQRTPAGVVAEVDRLLDDHTEGGVADALNRAGIRSGTGQRFHAGMVNHIRRNHGLTDRRQRLAARGLVDLDEAAARMGVCTTTVKDWHHEGRIEGEAAQRQGRALLPGAGRSAPQEGRPTAQEQGERRNQCRNQPRRCSVKRNLCPWACALGRGRSGTPGTGRTRRRPG